ncbi:MAG: hypothetical protein PHO65_08525 [Sulfurovum sp.]|nr:hypothetical protein [Sulfurovum sp.]
MTHEEIIESIKSQYNKDLRKQLVESLLEYEQKQDPAALRYGYQIMNQIYSYILNKLGWASADNASKWDNSPLDIMSTVFPKLEDTQWFIQQQLHLNKSIALKIAKEAEQVADEKR